jgi:hypothetical protein
LRSWIGTIRAWPTALRASSIWADESINKLIVSLTLRRSTALLAATGADRDRPPRRPHRLRRNERTRREARAAAATLSDGE